jgi:16S rRNA C1402 (ribose-2'-O) methylase RsmI
VEHFAAPRGEFVLVIGGHPQTEHVRWTERRLQAAVRKRLASGSVPTAVAAELAAQSGWARREIYRIAASRD